MYMLYYVYCTNDNTSKTARLRHSFLRGTEPKGYLSDRLTDFRDDRGEIQIHLCEHVQLSCYNPLSA